VDRATRYDAIIATFVGVLALGVSAYTAHVQRQQVRAQVYPIVEVTSGYSDNEVHVKLSNKGSGPALIRNVIITDEGKPLHDWLELARSVMGGNHMNADMSYSSFGRSVLSAGEQSRVFSFTCHKDQQSDKKSAAANPKPAASLPTTSDFLPHEETCARLVAAIRHMALSICYCSTLDDCWTLTDAPDRDAITTETRRCPARSDRSFN
jgi:hypothetical protein